MKPKTKSAKKAEEREKIIVPGPGFENVVILNTNDRIMYCRCVVKLRRITSEIEALGRVYVPSKWEPKQYKTHHSHIAQIIHVLELIQDAERYASQIRDNALMIYILDEIHLKRVIFYDILDVVRLTEKAAQREKEEPVQPT